jgi:tripartite-type tricarboxylate transporter receptor subunit TctC
MMTIPRREFFGFAAGAAAFAAGLHIAWAQSYPARPVRVVVPFAPGGPTDIFARLIVQKLSEQLGKQFYIENVGGASGSIGTAQVAKAPPDGHTILFNVSSFAINPVFFSKVPYDPFRDFEPVTLAATNDVVIVVHPSVAATTFAELVALIKAGGTKFAFSSGGSGAVTHLMGEQLKLSLGLDLVHVAYSGAGPAIAAVVAGHVPMSISSTPPASAHIGEGRLRAIAVTGERRSLSLPDVPTMAEAGYPETKGEQWVGVLAPAGTPKDIIAVLNREIARALASPEIKERLPLLGFTPVGSSPDAFASLIRSDMDQWGKVIRAANLKPE